MGRVKEPSSQLSGNFCKETWGGLCGGSVTSRHRHGRWAGSMMSYSYQVSMNSKKYAIVSGSKQKL